MWKGKLRVLAHRRRHLRRRPHRHGRLGDDHELALHVLADLLRHGEHVAEVRGAVLVGRGADGDEHDVRRRDGGRDVGREPESALALIPRDIVVEARLVDRQDVLLQPVDLRLIEVGAHDGISGLGQTRADDEADIAGPDHGDVHGVRFSWSGVSGRPERHPRTRSSLATSVTVRRRRAPRRRPRRAGRHSARGRSAARAPRLAARSLSGHCPSR